MGPDTPTQRLHAVQKALRDLAREVAMIGMSSEMPSEAARTAYSDAFTTMHNFADQLSDIIQQEMHATSAKLGRVFAEQEPTQMHPRNIH